MNSLIRTNPLGEIKFNLRYWPIGKLFMKDHFCYLAQMEVLSFFISSIKLKFKAHLRLKFLEVKIPLFHLLYVRDGFPDFVCRSI